MKGKRMVEYKICFDGDVIKAVYSCAGSFFTVIDIDENPSNLKRFKSRKEAQECIDGFGMEDKSKLAIHLIREI